MVACSPALLENRSALFAQVREMGRPRLQVLNPLSVIRLILGELADIGHVERDFQGLKLPPLGIDLLLRLSFLSLPACKLRGNNRFKPHQSSFDLRFGSADSLFKRNCAV